VYIWDQERKVINFPENKKVKDNICLILQNITFENSAVVVYGSMEESTYHPMLNISVIPQVRYKLAPSIWRKMYKTRRAMFTGAGQTVLATVRTLFITLMALMAANS
jgi:hypothetical protein